MDAQAFIAERPCLEEIDGYLMGIRIQIDLGIRDEGLAPDDLRLIADYKRRLQSGAEIPVPTRLQGSWKYALKRKPQRVKVRRKFEDTRVEGPVIDLHKIRKSNGL